MKKKTKRNRGLQGLWNSRFYRIYFIAVSAALVLIAFGLIWLHSVVRDYETAQPVHAAEVVADLFERGDYASLYAFDTSAGETYGGDQAFYEQSMSQLTQGKAILWREAFSPNPDEKKYTVTLDGDKFASFTLVPSGETTAHGNRLWQLGSVTTNVALQGTEEAEQAQVPTPDESEGGVYTTITVPTGCAVSVDGQALTEANVVRSGIPVLPEDFLPSGVEGPTMVEYGCYASEEPAIAVTDEGGAAIEAQPDGEHAWRCEPKENVELREQYADAIVKLGVRIAKYTVDDLSRDRIGIAPDSPAETILKKFSNSWAPSHKSTSVLNPQVSQFYVLSDDCFTCHVTFDFVLTSRRENDYTYPTAYTLCVIKRKGVGALYNIVFN